MKRFFNKLFDRMFIPTEAVSNKTELQCKGNEQIYIDGMETIKEINSNKICIRCKKQIIEIYGCDLSLSYFTDSEILIKGKIDNILYK